VWQIGPLAVSLRTGTNLRAIAAALIVWWIWRRRTLQLTARRPSGDWRNAALAGAACAGVAAALMSPILYHAWSLVSAGQYVTQSYVWRSAPGGVDVAGVVAGNPFNPWWGSLVQRVYAATGMDAFNDPIWFGIVPLVLLLTRRHWMAKRDARRWVLLTTVFLAWAVGPFLVVFGVNTGLPLPEILLRYVPIVSNARIPAHASVMVCLGVAMLLAYAISSSGRLRSAGMAWCLLGVILIDFVPAPFPVTPLERPPIYARLAAMPPGAVLDVPSGIRDGFGPVGVFDAGVLYFQTLHGKPIATGYVARLPPAVRRRYETSPVMQALFTLSSGADAAVPLAPAAARDSLAREWQVRYVVVHEANAPPAVRRFVEAMAGQPIDRDAGTAVYRLD
jgi:hypothetical protein